MLKRTARGQVLKHNVCSFVLFSDILCCIIYWFFLCAPWCILYEYIQRECFWFSLSNSERQIKKKFICNRKQVQCFPKFGCFAQRSWNKKDFSFKVRMRLESYINMFHENCYRHYFSVVFNLWTCNNKV